MQPHAPKNYSAADIERYHNGGMSPEEAHALERAALDDPFLSDAIDGYTNTKTPAADVAQLRQRLHKRSHNIFFLHTNTQKVMLRVAALVVLLAGLGWMVYKLTNSNDGGLALQMKAPAIQKENKPVQHSFADSAASKELTTETYEEEPTKEKSVSKSNVPSGNTIANKSSAEKDQATIYNRMATTDTTFSKPHITAAPMAQTAKTGNALPAASHTFNVRVVEAGKMPVPGAAITNLQTEGKAYTDAEGNFSTQATDSTLSLVIASPGYTSKKVQLAPSDSVTTIEMQRSGDQSLGEVSIVPKKKATGHNQVRLEAVEPLQGWKAFNDYVDQNLMQIENESKLPRGEVLLSFDVDRAGNAVNIVVEKPLCPSCDSTAIRLIRNGSRWKKKGKEKRAKAHILY